MSHTYAILEVSGAAYDEIAGKLRAAGYSHAIHGDEEVIDMHGIALGKEPAASHNVPYLIRPTR